MATPRTPRARAMDVGAGTSLGGKDGEFPSTKWSIIRAATNAADPTSREALERLCRLYWKPVYAYIRTVRSLSNEEAKDLTQEFFVELLEGGMLARFRPDRGSFRKYLKGALQMFLKEHHRKDQAQKRGGGRAVVSLDEGEVRLLDTLIARGTRTPEEQFDVQWANALLEQAVTELSEELKAAGRETWFQAFDLYELKRPPEGGLTYADVGRQLGMKETDVTNRLNHCKRRLREILVLLVRDSVNVEGDVFDEMSQLFPR